MHYIWKIYLNSVSLPNIIYVNCLKDFLKQKLEYKENTDCFTNITSKHLPEISLFMNFWNNNIVIVEDELPENENFYEYEINEILNIFQSQSNNPNLIITEESIIKIIIHFFPSNVDVIDNRYIKNIKCLLWDKCDDIKDSLTKYQLDNKNNEIIDLISIDDLYLHYHLFCNLKTNNNLIVSKSFFEKYIQFNLKEFIIYEKFVDLKWLY